MPDDSGLTAMQTALETARTELAAASPDATTATEAEAYLMRQFAAALSDAFLPHLFTENGLAHPLPTKGGPNPDYLMSHAGIDADRTYRIEGALNNSERVGIGLYSFGAGGAALLEGYAAFDRATLGPDGHFRLDLWADATGPGTLAITPGSRVIIIRVLHRSTSGQPARLTLSGHSAPPLAPVIDPAAAQARAAQMMLGGIRQFMEWTRLISAHPNIFIVPPPSIAASVQGDPDTCYRFGHYDLPDDESWLEVVIPDNLTGYWSLHAYNHWLESLPGCGIDDLNAARDPDGRIRIAVALGGNRANTVITQGRRRGILIFRTIGSAASPPPVATLHPCQDNSL